MDFKPKRKTKCCSTTSVIDMLSKCLCIRTPKVDAKTQQKIEQEFNNDLYEQQRVYKEPTVKRETKNNLKMISIPRVPLKIRAAQIRNSRGASYDEAPEVRPITMLVGTAKARDRKQRSVSIWAQERRRSGMFQNCKSLI